MEYLRFVQDESVRDAPVPANCGRRLRLADLCARRSAQWIVGGVAAMVAYLAPPDRAYAVLWQLFSPFFPIMEAICRVAAKRPDKEDCRTLTIQRALAVMTRCRPGFDLPLRVEGGEELAQVLKDGAPVILCTAHFGLTLAAPRVLSDYGRRVALIAIQHKGTNGWHWGLREQLQVLGDGPDALLRARTVLRSGQLLISYVDYWRSASASSEGVMCISPNIFRLAHLTGATLLFFGSRLEPDGHITIRFYRPQLNRLESPTHADLCAAEFVDFAAKHAGWKCVVQRKNLFGSGDEMRDRRRDNASA